MFELPMKLAVHKLCCRCAAIAAQAKDFDDRMGKIEARRNLPGDTFKVEKITLDILH